MMPTAHISGGLLHPLDVSGRDKFRGDYPSGGIVARALSHGKFGLWLQLSHPITKLSHSWLPGSIGCN